MFRTFIDSYLAGNATPEDIDDWVDAWHDDEPGAEGRSLDEYLGFTPDEGALWARHPSEIHRILKERSSRCLLYTSPSPRDS